MLGAADVIVGDATDLAMANGAFDIVVALDVFEHIEPARRADFLAHINRISRVATMLAAPFAGDAVNRAESSARAFWDGLFDQPYRWLEEHAENGLPDLPQTRMLISGCGMKHVHFGHGKLSLWLELMKAHFAAEACLELRSPVAALDRYYQDHLLEADVTTEDAYRQFLLSSRDDTVIAEFAAFHADLVTGGTLPDLTPLFEVLRAIQNIPRPRRVDGRLVPFARA